MEGFPEALETAIRELKYVLPKMKERFAKNMVETFGGAYESGLSEVRKPFSWYGKLEQYTIVKDGLKAFLHRLSDIKGNANAWLESVLSFLGQLLTQQWTDNTYAEAELSYLLIVNVYVNFKACI